MYHSAVRPPSRRARCTIGTARLPDADRQSERTVVHRVHGT